MSDAASRAPLESDPRFAWVLTACARAGMDWGTWRDEADRGGYHDVDIRSLPAGQVALACPRSGSMPKHSMRTATAMWLLAAIPLPRTPIV